MVYATALLLIQGIFTHLVKGEGRGQAIPTGSTRDVLIGNTKNGMIGCGRQLEVGRVLQRLYELLDRGEWVQVKREAERLMLLQDLDYFTLGRIFRAGGRACLYLSEYPAAEKLLELGLPYAFRAQDWDCIGFIRHDLGVAYLFRGETAKAREQFEAFLLGLARYQDSRRLEGKAHYNLGLLYRERKDYPLAVAAYRQALNCFVQRGETRNTAVCHQNIAWLLLIQGKADDAKVHVDLAAGFQDGLPPDFLTEQLVLSAFYHQVIGEFKPAMEYLSPILESRVVATDQHGASAKWVQAQLFADQGERDDARGALREALDFALSAKAAHLVSHADLSDKFKQQFGEAAV